MTTRPRDVTVELLYLDRESCGRCRATEAAVVGALTTVRPALALAGAGVVLDRRHVDSAATARAVDMAVSPTVRVSGRDLQPEFETSDCECSGDEPVPCRVWQYGGRDHESPPFGLIVDAVVRAAYGLVPTDATPSGTDRPDDVTSPVDAYFGGTDEADGGRDDETTRDDPCC
jgi:hypothetical protein